MSHFANPLKVTAMPATWSVRISVRASDTRIDEWSITSSDVQSVLTWPDGAGWRGNGELRVLLDHTGGSVAFHSPSGDRAIIRGPESMIHSFLAHLQAAYDELPASGPEHLPPPPPMKFFPYSYGSAAPESPGMQEVLSAIQSLSDAVRTALAASPAPQPMIQSAGVPTLSESVFIPSVLTTVEGTGLTADEKTSEATDLAAAAAALKSAKKKKNTPQEIP
jgi:hypothetical protein